MEIYISFPVFLREGHLWKASLKSPSSPRCTSVLIIYWTVETITHIWFPPPYGSVNMICCNRGVLRAGMEYSSHPLLLQPPYVCVFCIRGHGSMSLRGDGGVHWRQQEAKDLNWIYSCSHPWERALLLWPPPLYPQFIEVDLVVISSL